jgi:protein-tyrosine sulfotransferase
MSSSKPKVVFLLGIMPRSGTHYLLSLMKKHPDCTAKTGIPEDFIIANSDLLVKFVDGVYDSWNQLWGEFNEELKEPLYEHLGRGIENYLYSLTTDTDLQPKVCISSTPSVKNLELAPRITKSKIIILVRDGRSVIESGMRSFGWFFEDSVHSWASAADTIIRFAIGHPQMYIVKYEDLLDVQMRKDVLAGIFNFIGVDPEQYDYERDVDVIGSSTYYDKDKGINWGETKKTETFDPRKRWEMWERAKHERFNWIAGRQSQVFGYELVKSGSPFWVLYNVLLDLLWPVRAMLRWGARKVVPQGLRGKILWLRGKKYRSKVVL